MPSTSSNAVPPANAAQPDQPGFTIGMAWQGNCDAQAKCDVMLNGNLAYRAYGGDCTEATTRAGLLRRAFASMDRELELISALRGIVSSEFSIDHDHNRTLHRLRIRENLWKLIERASK